jgi:hypothetical protein
MAIDRTEYPYGYLELNELDFSLGTASYQITGEVSDGSGRECNIPMVDGSYIEIINDTYGYVIDEINVTPEQTTINESGSIEIEEPAELSFRYYETCGYPYDPEVGRIVTEDHQFEVSGFAGTPTDDPPLDGDLDISEDVSLILHDAVKNDKDTLGWVDVELEGELNTSGYYQILEGNTKDDVAKDVTGVISPNESQITFPSTWGKVIVWYIHPALDGDLVVESEFRERNQDEPFPGTSNESRVEVVNVSPEPSGENSLDVVFSIENVIVEGSGKTVDYNANIEVDSWVEDKVSGSIQPEEVVEHEVTITGIAGGTREVCVWV